MLLPLGKVEVVGRAQPVTGCGEPGYHYCWRLCWHPGILSGQYL